MRNYIAKIENHQSIIYLANDSIDAIKWANVLKRDVYGQESKLVSIWDCDEQKQVDLSSLKVS